MSTANFCLFLLLTWAAVATSEADSNAVESHGEGIGLSHKSKKKFLNKDKISLVTSSIPPGFPKTDTRAALECGHTTTVLYGGDTRLLQTPNFPNLSDDPADSCSWPFIVRPGVKMSLTCSSIDVPRAHGHFLQLRNGVVIFTYNKIFKETRVGLKAFKTAYTAHIKYVIPKDTNGTGFGFSCFVSGVGGEIRPYNNPSKDLVYTELATDQLPYLPCGAQTAIKSVKVVGGQEATREEYPWAAFIIVDGTGFCGASLISDRWVITAAHCINGKTSAEIQVYLGCHSRTVSTNDCAFVLTADLAMPHPFFDDVYHDVGLIRLSKRVRFSPGVYPVCLPNTPLHSSGGEALTIVGWGKEDGTSNSLSNKLKEASIETISKGACRREFQSTITDDIACGEGINGTICTGDSGSFVGRYIFGRPVIEALASFTYRSNSQSCIVDKPAGFAKIEPHLNWIYNSIKAFDDDEESEP